MVSIAYCSKFKFQINFAQARRCRERRRRGGNEEEKSKKNGRVICVSISWRARVRRDPHPDGAYGWGPRETRPPAGWGPVTLPPPPPWAFHRSPSEHRGGGQSRGPPGNRLNPFPSEHTATAFSRYASRPWWSSRMITRSEFLPSREEISTDVSGGARDFCDRLVDESRWAALGAENASFACLFIYVGHIQEYENIRMMHAGGKLKNDWRLFVVIFYGFFSEWAVKKEFFIHSYCFGG